MTRGGSFIVTEENINISESDLIVASGLCFIGLIFFYGAYILGREMGRLIFTWEMTI